MKKKQMEKFFTVLCAIVLSAGFLATIPAIADDTTEADETIRNFPVMTDIPPKTDEQLAKLDPNPQPTMSFDSLPSQFSWTNFGGDWTTPAKDQASCGSCWAFSALGAMEAAIDISSWNPNTNIDLSEQYILSCLGGAGSCSGGWMSDAIDYIQSTSSGQYGNSINGCPIESCMPYQAVDYIPCDDKCDDWDYMTSPPAADNKLFEIEDWGATTTSEDNPSDWQMLKTWIMTYGPLSVDILATGWGSYWSSNHDPNDVYENDDYGTTNHGVLLCGWVDDDSILNGGYWIIKNSWGTGWGYNGFGNIAYGCNGVATRDCAWVTTPDWPNTGGGDNPVDVDMAVFANFDFESDDGTSFPHLGDELEFTDTSEGSVAERTWDFDGDGKVDSTRKNPKWTYNSEGEYEVTLHVISEWGLNSTRTKTIEVRETWPPKAVINPDEYVDNELEVSFDGRFSEDRDGGQIVSYEWDFDDGSTATGGYVTHEFAQPDKIYEVTLTVTDDDGASETETCIVKIDQTVPPVTTINHGLGDLGNTWYGSTQRVSFEATDWTKVIDTFYRIDGGEWTKYIASENQFVPISGEGMHTVEAYSVDYYGNEEIPVSETFGIDTTPPDITVNVQGTMSNGWYDDSVTISVNGEDSMSGFDTAMYKVGAAGWITYTGAFSVNEGQHLISVIGVDEAGNTIEKQKTVNVDGGPPVSHVVFNGQGSNNVFFGSVDVRLTASDPGAGVEKIMYRLDGGSFGEYSDSFSIDGASNFGEHTIEFYAVDKLGNQESQKQVSFEVSPVNFVMDVDQPENALYLFGVELFSMSNPTIIGPVDVMVDLESFTSDPAMVEYVEFLIDGSSAMIDSEHPYGWRLDQQLFGSHSLTVKAVSTNGEVVTEEMQLTCFIF